MVGGAAEYLLAPALAWASAQLIKFLLNSRKSRRFDLRVWYLSGNMPSAHTATTVALAAVVGVRDGVESAVFAIAATLAAVTAYDAMMARRAAGEQGLALQKLLAKSPFAKDPLPYHALGHRPQEVAAGALLGLIIGTLVGFFITI